MTIAEPSPYVPAATYTPPIPKWKRFDDFADVLARDDPARSTPRLTAARPYRRRLAVSTLAASALALQALWSV